MFTSRIALVSLPAFLFAALFAVSAAAQTTVATVELPQGSCCYVAVNPALNKIYVSGGASSGQVVFVVDGETLKGESAGTGSGVSIDAKTGNYWAATVYGGSAIVRRGNDNLEVNTVAASEGCPVSTAVDSKARRAWVATQCGAGSDPVFAYDADSFAPLAGPIRSGGVLGTAVVNPATGRLYIGPSGQSRRVNPANFEVTDNAFGVVQAVDPDKGSLYALSGENLQIVNGKPDPEKITATVDLGYSPAGVVVDHALGRLYLSNPAKSCVEVRSASSGALIGTIPLDAGINPGGLAVDSARKRLYVLAAKEDQHLLFVIAVGATHPGAAKTRAK